MLFYKVLVLFWGCTRTCSHAWWFKNRILFYTIYIITITFSVSEFAYTGLVINVNKLIYFEISSVRGG